MVKIYKITTDPKAFALLPSEKSFFSKGAMFELDEMRSDWDDASKFYVRDPERSQQLNFFNVHIGALAFDQKHLK